MAYQTLFRGEVVGWSSLQEELGNLLSTLLSELLNHKKGGSVGITTGRFGFESQLACLPPTSKVPFLHHFAVVLEEVKT
jgi:hypothetical protein